LNFLLLKNKYLESLTIKKFFSDIELDNEIKSIKKLLSIKGLKTIYYSLYIDIDEFNKIKGINYDVNTLHLELKYKNKNSKKCHLYNLQNKFPNLTELILIVNYDINNKIKKTSFKIEENNNCIINRLKLSIPEAQKGEINFYCGKFSKLESINIEYLHKDLINIENSFPLFYDKCPIIFESLQNLTLILFNTEILNYLKNNIKNMPNLKYFKFKSELSLFKDEKNYEEFLIEILSLKSLRKINIQICQHYEENSNANFVRIEKDFYTEKEIKKFIPDIVFQKFSKIKIQKEKFFERRMKPFCFNRNYFYKEEKEEEEEKKEEEEKEEEEKEEEEKEEEEKEEEEKEDNIKIKEKESNKEEPKEEIIEENLEEKINSFKLLIEKIPNIKDNMKEFLYHEFTKNRNKELITYYKLYEETNDKDDFIESIEMFLNKATTKELNKKNAKKEIELKLSTNIENENLINESKEIIEIMKKNNLFEDYEFNLMMNGLLNNDDLFISIFHILFEFKDFDDFYESVSIVLKK
jgi:hypothetical protein